MDNVLSIYENAILFKATFLNCPLSHKLQLTRLSRGTIINGVMSGSTTDVNTLKNLRSKHNLPEICHGPFCFL